MYWKIVDESKGLRRGLGEADPRLGSLGPSWTFILPADSLSMLLTMPGGDGAPIDSW